VWPAMRASTGPPPAILLPLGHAAGGFSGPPHSPRPRQGPTLHGTATGSPTPPHRVPAVACEPHAPVNDGLVEAFPRGGTSLPGGHMGLLHRGPAGTRTPQALPRTLGAAPRWPAATWVSSTEGQPGRVPHSPQSLPPPPDIPPTHVGGRGCVAAGAAAAATALQRPPWVGGGAGGNERATPDTLPGYRTGVRSTPPKRSAEVARGTQAGGQSRSSRECLMATTRGATPLSREVSVAGRFRSPRSKVDRGRTPANRGPSIGRRPGGRLSTVRSLYKRQLIQLNVNRKWPTGTGIEDSRPIFSCKRFSENENALYRDGKLVY